MKTSICKNMWQQVYVKYVTTSIWMIAAARMKQWLVSRGWAPIKRAAHKTIHSSTLTVLTNAFYNLDKYILQFWKIHFTIWTNICNMDKYIFKYMNDMGADKKLSLLNQTFLNASLMWWELWWWWLWLLYWSIWWWYSCLI